METRSRSTSSLGGHFSLQHPVPRQRRFLPKIRRESSLDIVKRKPFTNSLQIINFPTYDNVVKNNISSLCKSISSLNQSSPDVRKSPPKSQGRNLARGVSSSRSISRMRHQTLPFGVEKSDLESVVAGFDDLKETSIMDEPSELDPVSNQSKMNNFKKLWEESVKHSEVLKSQLSEVQSELASVQNQLGKIVIQVIIRYLTIFDKFCKMTFSGYQS